MSGNATPCTGKPAFLEARLEANVSRNTRSTSTGIKTRSFDNIFSELSSALKIHKQHGSFLGGMHLELTGDAVTECTGGSQGLDDDDLSLNYTTYCDPRLNEKQALELAFLVAGHYREDAASP